MLKRAPLLFVLALSLLVIAGVSTASHADESIDAQMFRPSIFNGRFLAIEDAATLDDNCFGFGFYVNHANSLMEVREDDQFDTGVLESVTTLNAVAAYGLFSWWSIGLDIPVHLRSHGKTLDDMASESPNAAPLDDHTSLGDIKAEMKFALLKEESAGLGLALAPYAVFPTGDTQLFLGEGTFDAGGRLLLEKNLGFINIAANGGYLYRPEHEILGVKAGNAFLFGAGLGRTLAGGLSFSAEYWGQKIASSTSDQIRTDPMEFTLSLQYRFDNGVRIVGGGGGGLGGGLGSPSYRGIAGFDYYPRCEKTPEPIYGKLVVAVTTEFNAPLKSALHFSGLKEFDVETDEAGGYSALTDPGSYSIDASAAGYITASASAEIKIGETTKIIIALKEIPKPKPTTLTVKIIYDKDLTPIDGASLTIVRLADKKTDTHTAAGGVWSGEVDPGQYKISAVSYGFAITDGVFDIAEAQENVLTLKLSKKIILLGTIHFFFNSPRIRDISHPVLQDALRVIKEEMKAGGFKKLRIEGHTSNEGWDWHNDRLSEHRAQAVKAWLAARGIPADLMETVGFGERKPITDNATESGRQQNRRVEFVFVNE